jgi:hypothetical protein
MRYILSLFLVCAVSLSRDKVQRYQIIEVEHFSATKNANVSVTVSAGDKKSIILLDTYIGRTWYLSPVSSEASLTSMVQYQWLPLNFYQLSGDYLIQNLPPPVTNSSSVRKNKAK